MNAYDTNTGNKVNSFYPGAAIGGAANIGWTDIGYAVHAYKLSNGRYVVFGEDDGHGKATIYYW